MRMHTADIVSQKDAFAVSSDTLWYRLLTNIHEEILTTILKNTETYTEGAEGLPPPHFNALLSTLALATSVGTVFFFSDACLDLSS